jgi:HTH domain
VLWGDVARQPWDKLLEAALAECKRRGARLLIIDTLAPFAGLSGATENDAGHALDTMKPLQTVAAAGIGVVIVQHERKSGGDVGESGRGSTAFAGAADIILTLSRRTGRGQETLRDLHALSRFSETPQSLMIELTDDGYVSQGKIRPIATERAQAAILAVLPNKKKDAITIEEIIEESECSRTSVQRALNILRTQNAASRRGNGTKTSLHRFWRNS